MDKNQKLLNQCQQCIIRRLSAPPEPVPDGLCQTLIKLSSTRACSFWYSTDLHIRDCLCTDRRMYADIPYPTRVHPIFSKDLTARWYIQNSQLLSEIFKSFPGQRFGENVSNLFLRRNILQFDLLFQHLFPKKVILDRYMLGLWMHDRIFWNADCTCIIT